MWKWVLMSVSVLLVCTAPPALRADGDAPAFISRIEGAQPDRDGLGRLTLPQVLQQLHVPGVSIAVVRDFEVHWARGYGIADVEPGTAVDTDTLFQAASISKPVAAMAVFAAVQDGRLSLDADVNTFLRSWQVPRPAAGDPPVTLRSLLSHTSGAGDGFGFPGYDPTDPLPTLVQILEGERPSNGGAVLFERPPFTAFRYSGGGYTLLQLALMDVFDRPFEDLMRASVLAPLGMDDSTFEQPLPPARLARAARGHGVDGRSMGPKAYVHPEQAAAGLWTTPRDLARFTIAIQRALNGLPGGVLSPASAREMVTPVGIGPFALGLMVEPRREGAYFGHTGANRGFQSSLIGHVPNGYGLVVMTNGDGGGRLIAEIEARVARAYGWGATGPGN